MCPAPLRGLTILDSQVRVALFAEWDLDAPGGLRTTTAGLVDHSPDDIHVIPYLNQPGFSSLLRVNELIARLQRQRIELIHIASCGHVALLALLLAAKLHLPLVGSFDLDSLTTTALRRRYLRTLSEVCHKILVSSACAHETLRRLTDPANVAAWRPGVDIETFTPRKRSASLREQWQVSPDRAAVIHAGTLSEEHGVWRLLSLELELRRTRPMHRLIVAGDGPALMRLRYKCPHAIFLGHVPDSQMPELLASADVFVSTSERQSTHHAVLEAQACGLHRRHGCTGQDRRPARIDGTCGAAARAGPAMGIWSRSAVCPVSSPRCIFQARAAGIDKRGARAPRQLLVSVSTMGWLARLRLKAPVASATPTKITAPASAMRRVITSPINAYPHTTPNTGIRYVTVSVRDGPTRASSRKYRT